MTPRFSTYPRHPVQRVAFGGWHAGLHGIWHGFGRTAILPASAALIAFGAAAPVAAQDDAQEIVLPAFKMPQGCGAVVIVQVSDCTAVVIYTCEGDVDGTRHIATVIDAGLTYHNSVDGTYTWLESLDTFDGTYSVTELPAADPIDLPALVANGIDSFVLTQVDRGTGERITYRGYDWLSGYETVIDGVRLLESSFHLKATYADGSPYFEAEGTEYVDPELGLFHQGRTWYDGDPEDLWVSAPVEFVFPGEENDTVYRPLFGCEG